MNDTRNEIIRIGNELIRSVGYNAFSYADIAKTLGIKNAAIHYHFPAKSDLGVEIIRRNARQFHELTEAWAQSGYREQYMQYLHMHDGFIRNHWVCIVGALAPSCSTLPESMQRELRTLMNEIVRWLTRLLEAGRQAGEFSFPEKPETKALLIYSALLSALQISKALHNDAYERIRDGLLNI